LPRRSAHLRCQECRLAHHVCSLLTADTLRLTNLPDLHDVGTMRKLLQQMGVTAGICAYNEITFTAARSTIGKPPYDMVKTMRAAILVLGRCERFGDPRCPLPAAAPSVRVRSNLHIKGLQAMGAEIAIGTRLYSCQGESALRARRIFFDIVSRHRHRESDDGGGTGRRL